MTLDNIVYVCLLCGKEGGTLNHLFLHCDFISYLWNCLFKVCCLSWFLPNSLYDLVEA